MSHDFARLHSQKCSACHSNQGVIPLISWYEKYLKCQICHRCTEASFSSLILNRSTGVPVTELGTSLTDA
ncbi:hypothetical protein ARMGADRAFT_175314 [Armillaria gallica]|uniref:Uncharacterized protein n=1 Tax=Armillaria gallica TaxID=47427 RepID=A0A2H3C832_ARMGA|nr:hypothetical protein ARMGADRAFT_175314 [Armillaria gallica]